MTKEFFILCGMTLAWLFAFAWISTHYDPIHADQYESVEPQSLSLQRYHDINMDGEK